MKRIALLLALAAGSQGCVSTSQRGRAWYATDDVIVATALVLTVAGMAAAALLYQANEQDQTLHVPPYPLPPEQQPR